MQRQVVRVKSTTPSVGQKAHQRHTMHSWTVPQLERSLDLSISAHGACCRRSRRPQASEHGSCNATYIDLGLMDLDRDALGQDAGQDLIGDLIHLGIQLD
jgi:hypothetical protein